MIIKKGKKKNKNSCIGRDPRRLPEAYLGGFLGESHHGWFYHNIKVAWNLIMLGLKVNKWFGTFQPIMIVV